MIFKFLRAQIGDCTIIKYTDDSGTKRNIIIDAGLYAAYFDPATNTFSDLKTEVDDLGTGRRFLAESPSPVMNAESSGRA